MIIGSKIREARKRLGLTQHELGSLIHVTKTSISCYENGTRTPNVETLEDLAKNLNIPIASLFSGELYISENDRQYGSRDPKEIAFLNSIKNNPKIYNYLINSDIKEVLKKLETIIK